MSEKVGDGGMNALKSNTILLGSSPFMNQASQNIAGRTEEYLFRACFDN